MSHRPSRPMIAASADAHNVLFAFDTGADSEPVQVLVTFEEPAIRRAWHRGLNAIRARERAWKANPLCAECEKRIPSAAEAGLLELADGHRVACKTPCFVKCVGRLNPLLSRRIAEQHAGSR